MFARIAAPALIAALLLPGFATPAAAQGPAPADGVYISGQVGYNDLRDSTHTGPSINANAQFEHQFMGVAALGYAFGNGLRVEGEIGWRENDTGTVDGVLGVGKIQNQSYMLNGVYDIPTGGRIIPYIGAGIGFADLDSTVGPVGGSVVSDSDTVFAWQAILGVSTHLGAGIELIGDLRYFETVDPSFRLASGTGIESEYQDFSAMVGLRVRFGGPAPAPQPAPAAQPAPAPAPQPMAAPQPAPAPAPQPRSFLIFFDWDKSDIRPDARKILEAAAAAAKQGSIVKIQLTGHADRSGPVPYNQRLSERRAAAAKRVLVELGLAADGIATVGRGETQPLVPTDDGVREPRNRRVEIQF